ncbi:DUF397 domain-containing protein [Actinoplanes sp. G11-F43]|uniref:DUF397 domain-containing protein n=1 Tax=Actinoplanes sp. G11-F43 TaxID=3424130 RepID=UPI003D34345F
MGDADIDPLNWRKSSRSGLSGCVEVARTADSVLVRDSKNPNVALLRFTVEAWREFLTFAKSGQSDGKPQTPA